MAEQEVAGNEVTVLGAGIIGVCTALSALEAGFSVTLIDREEPGEATSYGNAGVISPWSCVPQSLPGLWRQVPSWLLDPKGPVKLRWRDTPRTLPWALAFLRNGNRDKVEAIADAMDGLMQGNVEAYQRYLRGSGQEDLVVESWSITLSRGTQRPNLDDLQWRLRLERGAPIEIVDGVALRDIEPALSSDYRWAVLIKDQGRARAPGRLCKVLAERAVALGACFHRTNVTALHGAPDGSLSLETAAGRIKTQRLVLCGGAWSLDLLKPFGYRAPLTAERGYHLEFPEPGLSLTHSVQDADSKVYISSMEGGVRIAGTAEFAARDAEPNYARARVLAPLAKRVLPALNTSRARAWMGVRPSFPDSLPAIGRLNPKQNLFMAFGHSHYGLGMAPATARLVAELLRGRTPNRPLLEAVNPTRWT